MPPKNLSPLSGGAPPPSAPTALIFGMGLGQNARRGNLPPRPLTSEVPAAIVPSNLSPNKSVGYNHGRVAGEVSTSADDTLAALKKKRRLLSRAFEQGGESQSPTPARSIMSPSSPIPPCPPIARRLSGMDATSMPPLAGGSRLPRTPPHQSDKNISDQNKNSVVDDTNSTAVEDATPQWDASPKSFPRQQYLRGASSGKQQSSEQGATAIDDQYPPTPDGSEVVAPKKAVAVSAATLKRRQAMEEKKAAANLEKAPPTSKAGASAPWRKKASTVSIAEPQVAPPPPPPVDRCRRLDEIILLLQAKGPQATTLIQNAMASEGANNGGKGGAKGGGPNAESKAMSPATSFEWVCHEKGLQELKEVFERWLRKDLDDRIMSAAKRIGLPDESELSPSPSGPSPSSTPAKRKPQATATTAVASPVVCGRTFFSSNALLKAFLNTVVFSSADGSNQTPTNSDPSAGHFTKGHPSDVLSAAGQTMYVPTDKEVQIVLNNATVVVRACLACSENGRSSVSKIAVEMMGMLCDMVGVARLQSYYVGRPSAMEQYNALVCSPASRALDHHADALINKLLLKGGTAAVKFLYDMAATSLLQLLRGVSGSSNKVLIGVLLQSLGSNAPKTEKSRILWGDAIAFSLVQRWSMTFLAPALNNFAQSGSMAYGFVGREAPSFFTIIMAVLTASLSCPTDQLPKAIAAALQEQAPIAVDAADAIAAQQLLTLSTTHKDVKELILKALPVVDILLADGSPDVRDSGRRVLLALLIVVEEHAAVNGYATLPTALLATPTPSPSKMAASFAQHSPTTTNLAPLGGIVSALFSSANLSDPSSQSKLRNIATPSTPISANSKEIPPTLDASIARAFTDAKARHDRMKETLAWARAAYQEGIVPLLLAFSCGGPRARPPAADAPPVRSPRLTTPLLPCATKRQLSPAAKSAAAIPPAPSAQRNASADGVNIAAPSSSSRTRTPSKPSNGGDVIMVIPSNNVAVEQSTRTPSRTRAAGGSRGGKSDTEEAAVPSIQVSRERRTGTGVSPPATSPSAAAMESAKRRPSNTLRVGTDARTSLLSQLQDFIESSGQGSSRGVGSRGATPTQGPIFSTSAPSESEISSIALNDEQKQCVSEWVASSSDGAMSSTVAKCIIMLGNASFSNASAIKEKDREMALRYLLYHQLPAAPAAPLPYAVGMYLLDALLSKATQSSHRVQGMALQILLMLCESVVVTRDGGGGGGGKKATPLYRKDPGHAPMSHLAFALSPDCIDALCGKSIGYLTTAMASSSSVVSTAAARIVEVMLSVVCGMLSKSAPPAAGSQHVAISSYKSLLYDTISTSFATRNPSARAALLNVSRQCIVDGARASLTVADVRYPIEQCAAMIASEVTELATSAVCQSLGITMNISFGSPTGTLTARAKTPAMAGGCCAAALQLLSSLGHCTAPRVKALLPVAWRQTVAPAIKGYTAAVEATLLEGSHNNASHLLSSQQPLAATAAHVAVEEEGEEDAYEDDFEHSNSEGVRKELSKIDTARQDAMAALKEFADDLVRRGITPAPCFSSPLTCEAVEAWLWGYIKASVGEEGSL